MKNPLPCPECSAYNNGMGSKFCLVCDVIQERTKGLDKSLRERLIDYTDSAPSRDYKTILNDMAAMKEASERRQAMTITHRAILTLSLVQFTPQQISELLSVSRKTIYRTIRIFGQ